jgi:hypothetical protein
VVALPGGYDLFPFYHLHMHRVNSGKKSNSGSFLIAITMEFFQFDLGTFNEKKGLCQHNRITLKMPDDSIALANRKNDRQDLSK